MDLQFAAFISTCLAQDKPAPAVDKTATPAAKTADKITLVYKAKKGLIARYKNQSVLQAEMQGKNL